VNCLNPPPDYQAQLDAFTKQTEAWRELDTKPPVSDEVTKKRLLAEDAAQRKDLHVAVNYYQAGLAINPEWAKGWYGAAFIYAQMKDYLRASFFMRHYLILMPDALDAQTSKDKALLWEAKAEEAAAKELILRHPAR